MTVAQPNLLVEIGARNDNMALSACLSLVLFTKEKKLRKSAHVSKR
jgi:hypothetical protein